MMEVFCRNTNRLKVLHYFCKNLHHKYFDSVINTFLFTADFWHCNIGNGTWHIVGAKEYYQSASQKFASCDLTSYE